MAHVGYVVLIVGVATLCQGRPRFQNDEIQNFESKGRNERSPQQEEMQKWMEKGAKGAAAGASAGFKEFVKEMAKEDGAPASSASRHVREDEKDPFQSFMEEMQGSFDKDFEEFVAEMEKGYGEEEKTRSVRDVRPGVQADRTTVIASSGKTEYNDNGRKGTIEDFMIQINEETSADFQGFLKDLEKREAENKKRGLSRRNELYQIWKINEKQKALQKFEALQNGRRNSRDVTGKAFPDLANFFPAEKKNSQRSSKPVTQQQPLENASFVMHDEPETQILTSAVNEASSAFMPGLDNDKNEGQNKAEEEGNSNSGGSITDVIPSSIKDQISSTASAGRPTLFMGGFSVVMMPMPNAAEMGQYMQNAQMFMNLMQMGQQLPTGK